MTPVGIRLTPWTRVPSEEMSKNPERLRVVVVDDHASMAETLAEGLEE
jgi:hypothetical protein